MGAGTRSVAVVEEHTWGTHGDVGSRGRVRLVDELQSRILEACRHRSMATLLHVGAVASEEGAAYYSPHQVSSQRSASPSVAYQGA